MSGLAHARTNKPRKNDGKTPEPHAAAVVRDLAEELQPYGNQARIEETRESSPLSRMSDSDLVATVMRGEGAEGARYGSALRNADELRASGIMEDLKQVAGRGIEVPESEYDRTLTDDAVLVMQDLAGMDPDSIAKLKEKAYEHPEVARDSERAVKEGYYGSAQHQQYGATVEALTGGVISAEEAMAMNPSGGIPGRGMEKVPIIGDNEAVVRHAMRHDATGFLKTRLGVGPGYATKTTPLGRQSDDPLAGHVLGLAREVFQEESVLPEHEYVGKGRTAEVERRRWEQAKQAKA